MTDKHSKPKLSRSILINMLLAAVLSVGLLAALWIHKEYADLRVELSQIRERHLAAYREILKKEVNVIFNYVEYQKAHVEPRLRESIQGRVNEAHAIALHIVNQCQGKISLVEMQDMVKESLRAIRFNDGRGYYFAINLRGEQIFSDRPDMEGKNLLSLKGAKGEDVVRDILDIVRKKGEGFYKYTWTKPGKEGHFPKIAYVKLFKPFGWVIGTGEYLDDAEKDIKKEIIAFIEQIRYRKDDYVFVGQWDGVSLTSPAKGLYMWDVADSNGKKIVQEMIRLAKGGSGFYDYVMPKLADKKTAPKLSYVVGVPEWKWYIGTGIYVDEMEKAIEQRKEEVERDIVAYLIKIAFVLAALLMFVFFIALAISRKVKKNLDSFSAFFEKATVELDEINPDIMDFAELENLTDSANNMVRIRRQTDAALRESEKRFAAIFDAQLSGIIIIDPELHIIVDANPAALGMIGAAREELIGRECHSFICPAERGKCPITDLGIVIDNSERVLIRADSTELAILKSVKLMKLGGKNFLIDSFIDITGRKHAEEEKQNLRERLQRAEKMEAIGQLAGGVAHDLNNVLGVLSGYSELLREGTPEGSRYRDYVDKILESTEKGAAIIQDLLTLARRGVTASDVVNINDVVENYLKTPVFENIKSFRPLVSFRTECEKGLLNIKGSPLHLEKTLMNLVANAVEAISGQGEVAIITENRYLDKPLRRYDEVKEGDYVVLTVSDTGMGIPDEEIGKIFQPFYTKKAMGRSGTGLGLAIVWGTVKDHDGYIDVQSNAG